MQSKNIIPIIIALVVAGGAGFYAGDNYAKRGAGGGQERRSGPTGAGANGGQRGQFGTQGAGRGMAGFIAGEVVSKDATSITLKLRDGGSKIVFYSSSTTVSKAASGSIDDVAAGANVSVQGAPNQDGSVAASNIQIRPAGEPAPMGMQPSKPKPLSDEQKAQLAAGQADHAPTSLTFNVNGGNFYFAPNEIKVKKGDKIKVILVNDAGYHDFRIDEFGVKTEVIKDGETATVEFAADKAGTFEYFCSVGSHRQMGMKGSLIVTE